MAASYFPLLLLIILSAALAVIAIGLPHFLGPKRPNATRQEPYESGMIPFANARRRFPIKYYLVAMLFLLFDIEVIFFLPWAVVFRGMGLYAFIAMAVFIGILTIGLIYEWKVGALEWE